MRDQGLQLELPVVDIEPLEHGLEEEVIIFKYRLGVMLSIFLWMCVDFMLYFMSHILYHIFLNVFRMMYRLHKTTFVQFMIPIQRRLNSRYESHRKMTPTLLFIEFESNLLISPDFLFHCAGCDVFLLFGPSMRLMSLVWKMSLSWDTVMVTVLCTYLPTTTLRRSFMSLTISWVPGLPYG